jgi:hypothetical protein
MHIFNRLGSAHIAVFSAALLAGTVTCAPPAIAKRNASTVHDKVLVLDGHVNLLPPNASTIAQAPGGGSRISIKQLLKGRVDAIVIAVQVSPGPETPEGYAASRRDADRQLV